MSHIYWHASVFKLAAFSFFLVVDKVMVHLAMEGVIELMNHGTYKYIYNTYNKFVK